MILLCCLFVFLYRSYVSALCEEVNETLQEVGQVAIADLSRNFGLPNNFLMEVCTAP